MSAMFTVSRQALHQAERGNIILKVMNTHKNVFQLSLIYSSICVDYGGWQVLIAHSYKLFIHTFKLIIQPSPSKSGVQVWLTPQKLDQVELKWDQVHKVQFNHTAVHIRTLSNSWSGSCGASSDCVLLLDRCVRWLYDLSCSGGDPEAAVWLYHHIPSCSCL